MSRRIAISIALVLVGGVIVCFGASSAPVAQVLSYDANDSPLKKGVLLHTLGKRLAIRESADSWAALVRKLKPTFAWNHCDMLWTENDSAGQPQFVLDEAYLYQPTNEPQQWVLLEEHSGETDEAYREVMGNNLRRVAQLHSAVPVANNDAGVIGDYAVVLSRNPALGTVYEIGWQQLMSAGTGHGENNRRIYLYRDNANGWHFLGEGIGVGNAKSGCCESLSTDVKARVVWLTNRNGGIPLEIKLKVRREGVQWDEAGKSHSNVSVSEAVLAGNFPAEFPESQIDSGNQR